MRKSDQDEVSLRVIVALGKRSGVRVRPCANGVARRRGKTSPRECATFSCACQCHTRYAQLPEPLPGVPNVHYANGVREQFRDGVPDPLRAVGDATSPPRTGTARRPARAAERTPTAPRPRVSTPRCRSPPCAAPNLEMSHRWFPIESHTTVLPFNYPPDRVAQYCCQRFSPQKRVPARQPQRSADSSGFGGVGWLYVARLVLVMVWYARPWPGSWLGRS